MTRMVARPYRPRLGRRPACLSQAVCACLCLSVCVYQYLPAHRDPRRTALQVGRRLAAAVPQRVVLMLAVLVTAAVGGSPTASRAAALQGQDRGRRRPSLNSLRSLALLRPQRVHPRVCRLPPRCQPTPPPKPQIAAGGTPHYGAAPLRDFTRSGWMCHPIWWQPTQMAGLETVTTRIRGDGSGPRADSDGEPWADWECQLYRRRGFKIYPGAILRQRSIVSYIHPRNHYFSRAESGACTKQSFNIRRYRCRGRLLSVRAGRALLVSPSSHGLQRLPGCRQRTRRRKSSNQTRPSSGPLVLL